MQIQFQTQIQESSLTFQLYELGTKFNRLSGIYCFFIIPFSMAEELEVKTGFYTLLYLGITNNFRKRLSQHHKIEQAIELGMTHIGILKISSGRNRKNIERKLLKNYNPPLNQTWLYDQNLTSNL